MGPALNIPADCGGDHAICSKAEFTGAREIGGHGLDIFVTLSHNIIIAEE
jgi:hypothetical protein